ncbi:unnamed protein product [Agarophyton chilense]
MLRPLLFLVVFTVLMLFQNASLPEKGHTQHLSSPNFEYVATLYPSYRSPRCVLFRCGPPGQAQTAITTSCDRLQATVIKTKTNLTARHCVSDFLLTQWDTLEGSYRHGVSYVANNVVLATDARELPHSLNSISLSLDEKRRLVSTQWFSFLPSNQTRDLLRAWLNNARNYPANDNIALTKIRGCAGRDISCHSRRAVIGAVCQQPLRCGNENTFVMGAARTFLMLAFLQVSISAAKRSTVPVEMIAMLLLGVSLLSMKWTSAACTIARSLFCRCKTSLVASAEVDGTLFYGDLRGWFEGRAYLLRDGVYEARITGEMQLFFPMLFGLYTFFKRVVGDWLLLSGAIVVLISAGVSRFLFFVSSLKTGGGDDKDEYVKSFDDIKALGLRKKGYGRRFLAPKRSALP